MGWKTVINSNELIILEKTLKDSTIRIEARFGENQWHVYKTSIKGNYSNIIGEFSLRERQQVEELISKLKSDKKQVWNYRKRLAFSINRIFKEEAVEKWSLTFSGIENIIYIRYGEPLCVDIILNEKIREYEPKIISKVEDKLALKDYSEEIEYNIYYYSGKRRIVSDEHLMAQMFIEFSVEEDNN